MKKVLYATNATFKAECSDVTGWTFIDLYDYIVMLEKHRGGQEGRPYLRLLQ